MTTPNTTAPWDFKIYDWAGGFLCELTAQTDEQAEEIIREVELNNGQWASDYADIPF